MMGKGVCGGGWGRMEDIDTDIKEGQKGTKSAAYVQSWNSNEEEEILLLNSFLI